MTLSAFRLFFPLGRVHTEKHGSCLLIVDDRNKVVVFAGTKWEKPIPKQKFEDLGKGLGN